MSLRKPGSVFEDRNFFLFFLSQTFLGCGALSQALAIARLYVTHTHSGLAAGFGMVCAPLPGVVLSLFAGSLGDRLPVQKFLVFLDLLKGFLTLGFLFCSSASQVFGVMLVVSAFDVLYLPSKNKLLTLILPKERLLDGNSALIGGVGAASLLTPLLVGLLMDRYPVAFAFFLDSGLNFLSASLLSFVRARAPQDGARPDYGHLDGIREGFRYCLKSRGLGSLILTLAVLDFGMTAVNIAFYSLAFDTLRVGSAYWGMLLSLLYGMNLFAMLLLSRARGFFKKHAGAAASLGMAVISLTWLCYGTLPVRRVLPLCTAAEGLSLSLCGTLLLTNLLQRARGDYVGRIMGIRDLTGNLSKLAGIGLTFVLTRSFDRDAVFLFSAAVLLLTSCLSAGLRMGDRRVGRAGILKK